MMIYSTWRDIHPETDTHWEKDTVFHNTLQDSLNLIYFFYHKLDPLRTCCFGPPTLLRKSLPQIARCLPGGACRRLWLMTVVLWLRLLVCHRAFRLVALFERFVGTCSESCSTVHLRAFITITKSEVRRSGGRGKQRLKWLLLLSQFRGPLP